MRDAVAQLQAALGLSERRACSLVGADRKMVRYQSCRPADSELRGRLRELANERRRFGYRRLFILLRREGEPSGVNRIHRLDREEDLSVRKRRARRKAVGACAPILAEAKAIARWSLDFVHDQFANGRRFRILNIVDDVTKECLGAIPDASISGRRVARELTAIIERRGAPGMIISDNGTEFTCNAMLAWRRDEPGLAFYRAGRCRMASSKASTAGCATNCSTGVCSSASTTLGARSRLGSLITITSILTHRWDTLRPRPSRPISPQQPISCATLTIFGRPRLASTL
ncbi:MAG: family transposase [Hyphomicrobiales bacterium]|nr:family transposase [Hyphomicrobiales bacterium]